MVSSRAKGRSSSAAADEDQQLTLALDTGTRKVMGIVYRRLGEDIEVVASARREHPGRAMRDGQIHDIASVARVIRAVKEDLEARVSRPLERAVVAAAGRALRTAPGHAERSLGRYTRIAPEECLALEWEAVADAQAALPARLPGRESAAGYYCVGHSVTGQWLDGAPISSLAGQHGEHAAVDVLATFLPRPVVDSLAAALEAAGLEMAGLTLEPIAALEAVVPPTMRHLNLALVDIGAGTADIALTREGAVWAYAMVPQAGDEVTEAASRAFLLDFGVAETAKRRAAEGRSARVRDILGTVRVIAADELARAVAPAVAEVAGAIAHAIRELNHGAPEAVLLVGGGSLSPGLRLALAEALGLSPGRVAVRGRGAIRGVRGGKELRGPDTVTPLGIALLHARRPAPLVRVRVEDRWVRLFQQGRCTVREALRAAGVPLQRVLGRPGVGWTVTVNGELRLLQGRRGRPGRVLVNGLEADLDRPLRDGDALAVEEAEEPSPPEATVADVLPPVPPLTLVVDGRETSVGPLVLVNGETATPDRRLQDRDEVEVRPCRTVGEVARVLRRGGADAPGELTVVVELNGNAHAVAVPRQRVRLNGAEALPDAPVSAGDRLDWEPCAPTVGDVLRQVLPDPPAGVRVTVNGRAVELRPPLTLHRNGRPADPAEPVSPGDRLRVTVPSAWRPLLHELLPHVELPPEVPGGRLVLTVDGEPAGYATPLRAGQAVEIRWAAPSADGAVIGA